jgi:lysyl-tRNA synthetase class 2
MKQRAVEGRGAFGVLDCRGGLIAPAGRARMVPKPVREPQIPMSRFRDDRLAKLEQMRARGVEPYGAAFPDAAPAGSLAADYTDADEGSEARVAGRLMAIRGHGKSTFADLHDWTGKIQVHFGLKRLGEEAYDLVKLLDLGDIVGVEGTLGKTRTGEVTVWAERLVVLAKALLPLPEKFHGLRDIERRSRQRSLDLVANRQSMDGALKRSRTVAAIRRFLCDRGFVEVETPMMQPIPGGAAARPFITHHNALDLDLYLRVSPELYLKRLLCGGMERVFEINRNFRNEGVSNRHNPEFTMLEVYEAYGDYETMMALAEEMVCAVAQEVAGTLVFSFGEQTIDFAPPWPRRRFADVTDEYVGVDLFDEEAVRAKAKELGVEDAERQPRDALVDEVFKQLAEPHLVGPMFLTHHPASMAPLCRRSPEDPRVSERFEVLVAGFELANAYTELNDPIVQRREFEAQLARRDEGTVGRIDDDFLTALEHGMPPAGGMGIGIDRLVMLLLERTSLRDVILFPLMRPATEAGPDAANPS